jgi:hypothetical protein
MTASFLTGFSLDNASGRNIVRQQLAELLRFVSGVQYTEL